MNQPCMDQNQPCMYLKSSKKQAQAAGIWLDKKSFPKQKNEEIPQKKIILDFNGMGLSFYCSADFLNYPIWSSHCMAAI